METEHVLRFAPTPEGFDDAVTRLRAILDARSIQGRHRHDIEILFDEVATNIVNHGRPSGLVEAVIRFGEETILTFEDDGAAFDLRAQPAPPPARRRSDSHRRPRDRHRTRAVHGIGLRPDARAAQSPDAADTRGDPLIRR